MQPKISSKEAAEECKRQYDSEDTKRRLLKAAMNVFSKEGYDAATTREIAKQAGVNISLIPRYFENKQGLFFAVVNKFHEVVKGSAPYPPGNSLEEELTSFFQFRMGIARKHKKFLKLIISRAILDPKMREHFGDTQKIGLPWLNERLSNLQRLGQIRSDLDVEKASAIITGISFAINMYNGVLMNTDPDYIQGVVNEALITLRYGLGTEKKS